MSKNLTWRVYKRPVDGKGRLLLLGTVDAATEVEVLAKIERGVWMQRIDPTEYTPDDLVCMY